MESSSHIKEFKPRIFSNKFFFWLLLVVWLIAFIMLTYWKVIRVKIASRLRQHDNVTYSQFGKESEKKKFLTKPRNSVSYITVAFFRGRLGNQMFYYGSLYGIARTNNITPLLPETFSLYEIFPRLTIPPMISKNYSHLKQHFRMVTLKYSHKFYPHTLNLTFCNETAQNISLSGYMQSYKYFNRFKNDVRNEFLFSNETLGEAKELLHVQLRLKYNLSDIWTLQDVTLVGIHVRRTDILRSVLHAASAEYIQRAMNYMKKRFKKVVFVVIGDDTSWNKMNIKGPDVVFMPNKQKPFIDMCIVSQLCDHVITTVGTFSFWCGYLSNGIVIYYKNMLPDGYRDETHWFVADDYWPPDWIGM